MDNISNEELHGIRVILETAAVGLAAVHAKPEDLEHLESVLKQMSNRPLSAERRIQLDSEFHITIGRASGNKLLKLFVEVMTMLLGEYMIKGFPGPASINSVINYHKSILEAIKNRNPEDAEEAMRSHLASARENVKEYEKKKRKGVKT
jgi:GntR family transcriptional repressor for pyruvate dehydrogenase complex